MTAKPLTEYAYFMGIAQAVARGAKCTRRRVGAIIVDENKHVVATGKNGSPPGKPECTDGACPRGLHYDVPRWEGDDEPGMCYTCETDWPCASTVEPGSSYDTGTGTCIAVHAEANALLNRTVPSVRGCTMYVTEEPCDGCIRLLMGAQLILVVSPSNRFEWIVS
jgi:dCMP deaminase